MTMRARTTKPPSITTRVRRQFEGEDRQQAAVTVLFGIVIVVVLLIMVGAVALSWYNDNLRPLARVGSVEVGPQTFRNYVALQQWRISEELDRLTAANINQEIDSDTLAARQQELDQQSQALSTTGLTDLVDMIYQSQLAPDEGVNVTDADVEAQLAEEVAGTEKRHVYGIAVKPIAAEGADATPSLGEQRAALEKAEAALAALDSGTDFATVFSQYNTDTTAPAGGDYGVKSQVAIPDQGWATELFKLDQGGTTGVVRGTDGVYRVGRVTEIQPAGEQPGLRDELIKAVPDPALHDLLRYQVGADMLKDKVTADALAATPEQARIAIIYIEGAYSEDPEDAQGEVDYSEIVFSPNDDIDIGPTLPEGDTAWTKAQQDAQAVFDQLNAIPAGDERKAKFEELAAQSDSPTGEDKGAVGWVTRSIPPEAVGDALFDTAHKPGDLLGPIRGDAGYYVLLYNDKRPAPEQRVADIKSQLAQPGADFNQIAKDNSDGPEAVDGGEVGWVTRDQLSPDLVDSVINLAVGGVTEPLELGEGHYFVKLEDKTNRALDADQIPDVKANAFEDWFSPKRDQAKVDGVVVIAGEEAPTPTDSGS
jgi:parvulin-like peptidyl-prolyl isomerase